MNTTFLNSMVALALLLLAACAEQPAAPVEPGPQGPERPDAAQQPVDEVDRLLAAARNASGAKAAQLRLDAVGVLIERNDPAAAREVLDQVVRTGLPDELDARCTVQQARIEMLSGRPDEALLLLDSVAFRERAVGLGRTARIEAASTRADALAALGRDIEAARERAAQHVWLNTPQQRSENATRLFASLLRAPVWMIDAETVRADSEDWRGWLELAETARDIRRSPSAQLQALEVWEREYERIPALETAVRELLPALKRGIREPARAALLLPISGRTSASAQAVLEGYLSQYYQNRAGGEQGVSVTVFDTTAEGGLAEAYRGALAEGADVVIGPLLKTELSSLVDRPTLDVPTLALNFSQDAPVTPEQLYQFGLDTGDEIRQLVAEAKRVGYRRILILADDSPWSRRLSATLGEDWSAGGGVVLATLFLQDLNDYRRSLEATLHIDQSKERTRELARILNLPFESEPRRREDVDAVVMVANPTAARALKPLLSFVYAGDLPVWGISQIYSGRENIEENRDLDAVRFIEMPWFSGAENSLRDTLPGVASAGSARERLVALGVDAFRLQSRLTLFDQMPGYQCTGATGNLFMDEARRIRRSADWYVFKGGIARAEHEREPLAPAPATDVSTEGEQGWPQPEVEVQPASDGQQSPGL